MKKTIGAIIIFLFLIGNFSAVYAEKGYNADSIDSYVGQKIIDLNYYHASTGCYPYKKRLDEEGTMQCVGYVYARTEEKLGLSPGFDSGLGAKDIPNNAPNGQTRTAIDGTVYTIEVYKNDNGSHITADCWVSFGSGSSSYGHVIYVEEVIGDTVYYSESGSKMWREGNAGILRKQNKYDFINHCSSGGSYVGTVVFRSNVPKCSHSYTDPNTELCQKCGEKFQRVENSENKKYTVNVKSIHLRTVPYAKIGGSNGVSYAGEVVTSSANVINMYGNKWVKITNSKGQSGYTSVNNLKEYSRPAASSLNIDLSRYPTLLKKGSNFGLRGTVASNYEVKQIKGFIYSDSAIVQSTVDYPNKKSVDVKGLLLNSNLVFNRLGTGNYTLAVEATDSSGNSVTVKKAFRVYEEEKEKTPSSLSINLTRYPVTLNVGSGFGLRGTVDSNYSIARVKGYVKDANGTVVLSSNDTPNTKSMNIQYADLNNSLVFNRLAAGNYIMIVEATDTAGRVVTATKEFSVKAKETYADSAPNGDGVTGTVNIPSSWDNLSIRTGPSTSYQIIGSMNQGVTCTVYPNKTVNGWYYVNYNGIWGYASGKQINLNSGTLSTSNTRLGIVNIPSSWDDLSIRTGPSTNYQIVGGMPNGARCTVYPEKTSNGWYYVEYNGVQGYAAGNRIDLQ